VIAANLKKNKTTSLSYRMLVPISSFVIELNEKFIVGLNPLSVIKRIKK